MKAGRPNKGVPKWDFWVAVKIPLNLSKIKLSVNPGKKFWKQIAEKIKLKS